MEETREKPKQGNSLVVENRWGVSVKVWDRVQVDLGNGEQPEGSVRFITVADDGGEIVIVFIDPDLYAVSPDHILDAWDERQRGKIIEKVFH